MYKNIVISTIIAFLILSCSAFSQNAGQYRGTSITDFTIYKVVPQKTSPAGIPDFNAEFGESRSQVQKPSLTENKQTQAAQNNTIPAKKTIPAVTKKVIKKSKKTPQKAQKPAKKNYKTKKTANPPVPNVKKVTNAKQKNTEKNISREKIPETLTIEGKFDEEKLTEKLQNQENELITSKDRYVEKLNKYLDNDSLTDNSSEKTTEDTLSNYDYIIKPSISLGIVLLLMFLLAWFYSRMRGIDPNASLFNKFGDSNINKFKILATSTLGQGKIIQLVEINGKQLVIGSTNNNINLLTEITLEEMENLQAQATEKKRPKKKETSSQEDEYEYYDPDSYSAKYSDIYKEYTGKNDK